MNTDISVLFVGDPALGQAGLEILSRHFRRITPVIWRRGDKDGREEARRLILGGRWSLLISFYNDLIFSAGELERVAIPLNIHPATPRLRGVGYDTLPLLDAHGSYGATLHRLTPEIDAGEVIEVMTRPLAGGLAHSDFRPLTQALSLNMLEHSCRLLAPLPSVPAMDRCLAARATAHREHWDHAYVSRCRLRRILDELRRREPEHPVFR